MAGAYGDIGSMEFGLAAFTNPGQDESGDLHVIKEFRDGILVGVVDGLGHGNEAAFAAKAAVRVLEKYSSESVISLLRRTHEELRATRGVVMSLASINVAENMMTWMSIGNVEGILLRADRTITPSREIILLRGGVVGYNLPQPFASVHPIYPGDILIFATDGIDSLFHAQLNTVESPQRIADKICAQWCKGTDDALVLVAKYIGR